MAALETPFFCSRRRRSFGHVAALLAASVVCGATASGARAQSAPAATPQNAPLVTAGVRGDAPVSLSLDGDVRGALKSLFGQAGANYVIGRSVPGSAVTLELKNVSFTDALRLVLRSADLTYTVENGVYVVAPRSFQATGTDKADGADKTVAALTGLAQALNAGLVSLAEAVKPPPVPLAGLNVQQIKDQALAQEVLVEMLKQQIGPSHPRMVDARSRLNALRAVLNRYQRSRPAPQRANRSVSARRNSGPG